MKKMHRLLLGTSLSVGLALAGGSAFAADLMAPPPAAPAAVTTSGGGYVSVFGGYGLATTVAAYSTDGSTNVTLPLGAGYIIGAAIGTRVSPNVRLEGELSYSSRSASGQIFATGGGSLPASGTLGTLYLLGNLWFDLNTGSGFTPYIGGGLGVADVMPNLTLFSGPSETFTTGSIAPAAQLGVGVKFDVADNISLDLGYRIKDVFNASFTGSFNDKINNVNYLDQSVQVGLNIGF